ncbi:MAG: UDP-N-acetylmuramoyl-L-alanyl-D-glutamate--2,6-diaminopimelate ligase [Prevotellaceae bacterium]|jgi:UDP-N-acetylmuramoyl-L-alanyl-D-glutamate--2,6-diaminopimelate ligase|nr:UDP-N-acetylmuramoyl-L-alanyl-D-glutamate--2,6-diaminopimelate ligase [Prevotellaceae bacterium]
MNFTEILKQVDTLEVHGSPDVDITSISNSSREAGKGCCFVALRGAQADGHAFIPGAVAGGAAAVICEQLPDALSPSVCYAVVKSSSSAVGLAASAFYGNPSRKLRLVGITGTNGKTTTATLLYRLFKALGYKVGLISTVVYQVDDTSLEATNTTPDAITLNRMMRQMVEQGCSYCFMEVSSHAIVQQRIGGLHFAGGIFSNLTHDHLDYHRTFEEYLRAKKMFFDALPKEAFALTNADERNGKVMVQNTQAQVKTYGLRTPADFKCRIVEQHIDGMLLDLNGTELWTKLIGDFNAYNVSAVYGAAMLLGASHDEVVRIISTLSAVAGRFEYVKSDGGVTAIVDYAHTPDALANVLATINRLRRDGQKLIVVVGCGGNRDRTKRPIMAHEATENSDVVILTSDNPREENPQDILDEMYAGVSAAARKKTTVIADRREAINTAVTFAQKGDIILVAGKGHETYQIVGKEKLHFDDKEALTAAFAKFDPTR